MRKRELFAAALLALGLYAQATTSVWDGIYTEKQAKQGGERYGKACASCHGEKLEGKGQAPPLAGAEFTSGWNGMTMGDLFEKIQVSMPGDRPGQLSREENATILAYILRSNKFPSGMKDLPVAGEALNQIRFESSKTAK